RHRSLDPRRQGVATFDDYVVQMGGPEGLRFVNLVGGKYLVATGRTRNLITVPSGPSEYVFDHHGELIDWSADVGDDDRFAGAWRGGLTEKGVSLDVARLWPKTKK